MRRGDGPVALVHREGRPTSYRPVNGSADLDFPIRSQQARKAKRQVIFKRAEQYVNEYKKAEREEIRLRRAAKASGDFYVPAQPKVYFVMRIKG
jgi:hypothetical protein